MVKRVLALNNKGQFTYCTSPPELRGKGRCNHSFHRGDGQTAREFVKEMNEIMENKNGVEIVLDENEMIDIRYKGDLKNKENKDLLFKEVDGKYVPTEYAKYIILSQGKKTFAKLICDLDKEQKFHRESTAEVVDPAVFYNELKHYQENKREFEALMEGWKKENADKFSEEPFIPSIQRYARNFKFNTEVTLEEAIQGYKYCNAKFKELNREELMLSSKVVIKPEYKEEYTEVAKKFREKTGFPTESEIKAGISSMITERRTRLALNRQKFESIGGTDKYATEYVKYLAEADFTPKEYDWNSGSEDEE